MAGPLSYSELDASQAGIWRYLKSLGLPSDGQQISLGEGNTPLVFGQGFGKQLAFKLESQNPSGSYKDRGSALLASWLLSRGVDEAVEDSSGNAGASFAAYAARAGIRARIFVPAAASGPKRKQIEAYGAELQAVEGPRSAAADAVQRAAADGAVYASHAYLPFGLPGIATIAYELCEQLGRAPGAVLAPVGHGSLLLGIALGFETLLAAGKIAALPQLIGVQARACAPLWSLSTQGYAGLAWVTEGETLAEGVRVRQPLRGDALLAAVERSGGQFAAVEENEILPARDALASVGLFVEPTSAIVWAALSQVAEALPDPVVLVLTGSGLKAL
ncbi:MAG: pyridoxal-phosphate dependent enzyme [Anaerolineales bacterium]|nr:pyridoxal-phosphate dependent enzyme [Anaerolineales bacterium]MCW5856254.1 pyridoxal-phosphate dependent enzyme [Anaerolineales bacterium]